MLATEIRFTGARKLGQLGVAVCLFMVIGLANLPSAQAAAVVFDGKTIELEYWAGSGSNQAVVVVDFGSVSKAYGYKWDGSATSWDMLDAIDVAGSLDVTSTYFPYPLLAHLINGLTDGSDSIAESGYFGDPNSNYTGYWNSTDGMAWTSPYDYGVDGRNLTDGDWDGWSLENTGQTGFDFTPHNPPTVPLVPEPATAGICLLSLAMLGRSWQRPRIGLN
ncbi:MAG: hypothetical protein GC164_04495 [Phycisphaera sp.]|nr:hypothetical protein [Phycisphaera sp.]